MRISKIVVHKLFGIFNHEIPMTLNKPRITIIHSPNGFGKTIVLRMIYGLFESSYQVFRTIPFEALVVSFDDGSTLTVDKVSDLQLPFMADPESERKKRIRIEYRTAAGESSPYMLPGVSERDLRGVAAQVERTLPELDRVDADKWVNRFDGQLMTLSEIIDTYGDRVLPENLRDVRASEPKWFEELKVKVNVKFIQAQRLQIGTTYSHSAYERRRRMPESSPAVRSLSKEIAFEIQSTLARYAELSQTLDSTFPLRLLDESSIAGVSSSDVLTRLERLEEKRIRLMDLGLLDREMEVAQPRIAQGRQDQEVLNRVLSIYVADNEEKLQVFDELKQQLEILTSIVKSRFQYKKLIIDRRRGFVFISPSGHEISPEYLSSGEQHELVMLYQLLFQVQPDSLILIDEPELSLHVAWQRRFLDDLQQITELRDFDVLIATHAPQIVNERSELMIALQGPEQNE